MNSAVFLILGALLLLAAAALLWAANRPADDREWRRVLNRHAGAHERSTFSQVGRGDRSFEGEGTSGSSRSTSDNAFRDNADAGDALPPRRRNPRLNPQQAQTVGEAFSYFGVHPQSEAEEERANKQKSSDDGRPANDVSVTHADEPVVAQRVQSGVPSQHGTASQNDGEDNPSAGTRNEGDERPDIDSPSTSVPSDKADTTSESSSHTTASASVNLPTDIMEEWFANPTRATRRARRSWAVEHGWQFDRNDPDLAHDWADHVGASSSEAKDVVSGRMRARRAHVADINDNSYLGLCRSGSSDILIDFRDRDRWEIGRAHV